MTVCTINLYIFALFIEKDVVITRIPQIGVKFRISLKDTILEPVKKKCMLD